MIELVIDPKRAFGTGFHATTQLAIEWLEDRIQGGEGVLDCGTGSGILAMVALRLGAQTALGIDNDPIAIECAREYAAVNGFGSQLDLRVSAVEESAPGKFDVVLANLDLNTLLRHCRALVQHARSGGALFVAGICPEDCDEIASAFSGVNCSVSEKRERAGWLALELVRL
jgi:ribosomal protein L11 methyltransferase